MDLALTLAKCFYQIPVGLRLHERCLETAIHQTTIASAMVPAAPPSRRSDSPLGDHRPAVESLWQLLRITTTKAGAET